MVRYEEDELFLAADDVSVKVSVRMVDLSERLIHHHHFWLPLTNKTFVTVFIQLIKERPQVPSVEISVESGLEL